MSNPKLSAGEIVFCGRMRPHIEAGCDFETAARKVLDDDQRLFSALLDRSHSVYVPTYDERGQSYSTGERPGDLITREIAKSVYQSIRAKGV